MVFFIFVQPPIQVSAQGQPEDGRPTAENMLSGRGQCSVPNEMTTLVALLKQQTEWAMRAQEARRAESLDAAEALEMRMRKMEVSRVVFAIFGEAGT